MAESDNKVSTSQGLAIASLALGIVSIVVSLVWFISIILGVLAIVFGAVSLKSAGRKKAIAGLTTGSVGILLSVLWVLLVVLALPALQQGQRDTSRKNDVSTLVSDVINYQSNNRGQLPAASDLSTYSLGQIETVTEDGLPSTTTAIYNTGAKCGGGTLSARSYSVTVLLENGSTYCLD